MKFDFIIGNPPYQEDAIGDNKNFTPPVYHKFIDEVYCVGNKVELIHPARFLFDAGATPKEWNRKMLNDPQFKVLFYESDSKKVFPPPASIKGGIAITYHDNQENFGVIGIFYAFDELRSINEKVATKEVNSLSKIIYPGESFKFTEKMHIDHPDVEGILSANHKYDFKSSVLEKLDKVVFYNKNPEDGNEYVGIVGLIKNIRVKKFIRRDYIRETMNFNYYKVFVPNANGSGALGEVLSTPLIGQPLIGHTQSFISIGCFDYEEEAIAAMKYIKTKFTRVLLGILKVTQSNPPEKWKYVPLQDFTEKSDIDWSQSIAEIDQQLYKKYGLDDKEITFIETHVKEMS